MQILATTNACMPTLDAALLDALPTLRAVVLYATGYDHIDVELLASRDVGLTVLPDYATNAVAEHAMAMLLSMATRLHLAHGRSRGTAPSGASLRGIELAGRTMGVLGVGRIGTRVAQLGAAFGMRVIGYDHSTAAIGAARHEGIAMTTRDHLLAEADALIVCASHAYDAPAVIGRDELDLMRSDAFVINVARAALVDTAAITAAIRAGAVRGYAVDDVVLDPAADGDLLAEGRVLQTAHSAWWRDEVLDRGWRMWAHHLLRLTMPGTGTTDADADAGGARADLDAADRGDRRARAGVGPWLLLAAGLAALAIDERFALHERLRDGVLAPRGVTIPFLPWVGPGDFLLLAVGLVGLAVLPMVWRAIGPDAGARRALLVGVGLAVVAVGMDSIDPTTWTTSVERVEQTVEEVIELASALALLAAVALHLLGRLDAAVSAARHDTTASSQRARSYDVHRSSTGSGRGAQSSTVR